MIVNQNVVTEINASTFTEITIPGANDVRPIAYYTEDGSAFIEADDISGTNPATIPADTKVSTRVGRQNPSTILFIKASAGTINFVVKIGIPE